MHLLRFDARGALGLTEHKDGRLPPYAILSHTWATDNDEPTFNDIKSGLGTSKKGYEKVMFCGRQAQKDDLQDFWVDSCCINRPNYTELSEAINSVFRWYSQASKCYVYLSDVTALKRDMRQCQHA
ncbi:hypothetical protein BST61_g3268 [Cercospora zeina]